jgi:hypothetical protein
VASPSQLYGATDGDLVRFIFILYFVRLLLCNNDIMVFVTFICAHMRRARLYPLNPGVTIPKLAKSLFVQGLGEDIG